MSSWSTPLLSVTHRDGEWGVRTPAKLNLFLEISGKRPDGFHELTTLLMAIDLWDELRVRELEDGADDSLVLSGIAIPPGPQNLVTRALESVRKFASVGPLEIQLDKHIPPGSGLGGGSGNAVGMLAVLRDLLEGSGQEVPWASIAAELGSDVPFFASSGVAVARGRGELLEPLEGEFLGGDDPTFAVILPPVHSDTAAAYGRVTLPLTSPDGPISFDPIVFATSRDWTAQLFNRLEAPVCSFQSELAALCERLRDWVPGRWRMSGSGSAFFVVCFDSSEWESLVTQVQDELGWSVVSTRRVNV